MEAESGWSRRALLFGRPAAPPVASALRARVLPFSCTNAFGDFCATCGERCPVAGAVVFDGRVPRVDPERCDGCGACATACPAPGGAIVLAPVTTTEGRNPAPPLSRPRRSG